MEDQATWTCSSTGAVQVSLVQPSEDGKLDTISSFFPEFTYSIFGDSETIFGYKGLMIQLRFAAHDLRSNVLISYDEKFKAVEDVKAFDLNKALEPFLPKESFAPLSTFEQALLKDESAKTFEPPGKLVHTYTRRERNYEIWAGSLADPAVQQLLNRIQIFVSLFIEAGTPIETDDFEWTLERWTVYFVYEKLPTPPAPDASVYSFVGYSTTYRWYFFDKPDKKGTLSNSPFPYTSTLNMAELPSRLRISQFLILQPHQSSGHGSELYNTIFRASLDDPTIHELTVEDPNEAFDALRDINDYQILLPVLKTLKLTINPDPTPTERRNFRTVPTSRLVPIDTLENLRRKFKIAPTQFAHLIETYLLSLIPTSHRGSHNVNLPRLRIQKFRAPNEHDRRYYWWRMLVKQRLYKRHRDMLAQIDRFERVEKLEETVHNVEEGYEKRLEAIETRARGQEDATNGKSQAEETEVPTERSAANERTKRKFVVMEEDEEEENLENGGSATHTDPNSSKKAKV